LTLADACLTLADASADAVTASAVRCGDDLHASKLSWCPNAGFSIAPLHGSIAAERLAQDWENLNRKALAFLRLASLRLVQKTAIQAEVS